MGIYFPISFSESNRKFSENDTRGQIGKDINQHQYCHHSQWKMTKDLAKKMKQTFVMILQMKEDKRCGKKEQIFAILWQIKRFYGKYDNTE